MHSTARTAPRLIPNNQSKVLDSGGFIDGILDIPSNDDELSVWISSAGPGQLLKGSLLL
jgi:hypothetical protein